MEKLLYILVGGGATLLVLMLSSAIVSRLFVARSKRKLINTISRDKLPAFSSEVTRGLPAPVQRYLHAVLKDGQPALRYAVLEQRATFRHRPDSPWFRVKATEVISGMEPGWVWDAMLIHNAAWWRTAKLSYVQGGSACQIKEYAKFSHHLSPPSAACD